MNPLKAKSKRVRIVEHIKSLPDLGNGYKRIPEYDLNIFEWVTPNQQHGALEDIAEEYIMKVANSMGYKCLQSNFGGIILRRKES